MKKRIGIILSMIIVVLAVIEGIVIVQADNNYITTPNIPISAECTTGNCGGTIILGVRVSLVGPNGDMITTRHIDYLPDSAFISTVATQYAVGDGMKLVDLTPGTNGYLQNVTFGTQTRQEVIRNGVSFTSGVDYWHLDYVKKMGSLVGHQIAISSSSISLFADDLKNTMIRDNSKITTLLQELHYGGTVSDAVRDDLYFQIEPIVITPRRNKSINQIWFFAGTETELVQNGDAWVTEFYLGNNHNTSFIHIESGKKRPTIFTDGSGTTSVGRLKNEGGTASNIIGDAVGHLWISDLVGEGCENAAAYLNNGHMGEYSAIKNGGNFRQNGNNYSLSPSERDRLDRTQNTAVCNGNPPPNSSPCGQPATTHVDACSDGLSYYQDHGDEQQWLKCGIAYEYSGEYYSSENTGHLGKDENGNDGLVGNSDYCQIFCREDFSTNFPTTVTPSIVKAGQTFGWGINGGRDGIFGTLEISKSCSVRQNGYKYSDWLSAYKANAEALIKAYLNDLEKEKVLLSNGSKVSEDNAYCEEGQAEPNGGCYKTEELSEAECNNMPEHSYTRIRGSRKGNCKYSTGHGRQYKVEWKKESGTKEKFCTDSSSFLGAHCYEADAVSVTKDGFGGTAQEAQNNAINAVNYEIGASNSASTAKATEASLLTAITQCVNNLVYQNGVEIDFTFDEPVNIKYGTAQKLGQGRYAMEPVVMSGSLESTNTKDDSQKCTKRNVHKYEIVEREVPSSTYPGKHVYTKVERDDAGNEVTKYYIKEVSQSNDSPTTYDCEVGGITWNLNVSIAYKYPAPEFTWFTLKTDGTLKNLQKKTDSSEEDTYHNLLNRLDESYFYYIGYGLPTAVTLTDGTYNRLKVEVYKVGDQDPAANRKKANNNADDNTISPSGLTNHFEPLLSQSLSNGQKGFDYTCPYKVENDLFGYDCRQGGGTCDSTPNDDDSDGELKGVDVVYRVISLLDTNDEIRKAFPGREARPEGRRRGSNWQGYGIEKLITDTERSNGVTVDDKIHEILRSDVYTNSEAMYDIMLDVKTIQEIRNDTETFSNDPNNRGDSPYTTLKNVTCKSLSNDPNNSGYNVTYCASDFITELIYSRKLQGKCAIYTGGNTNRDTAIRAEHILASGCDASYTPINPNWSR